MSDKRALAIIDLQAYIHNLKKLREPLGDDTKMFAVIKANGYGHGAIPLAKAACTLDFIDGFALATIEEAAEIRKASINDKRLIVLGETFPDEDTDNAIIEYDIMPTVTSFKRAKYLSKLAIENNKKISIQIKLNTGMNRIGFVPCEASYDEIDNISKLPGIELDGLFTHFARADEEDIAPAQKQLELYLKAKNELDKREVKFNIYHCANSAATMRFRDAYLTHVRAGISMYGLPPSEDIDISELKPILSLKSHVVNIQTVPKGSAISYGGTFVTKKTTTIATIPIGYADGYPRSLSNKGYVLVNGKKAPILGRICMDQFMVDVSDVEGISVYDEVTLVGNDGDATITIEELSELSGRFPYEFVCCLGNRVFRKYIN